VITLIAAIGRNNELGLNNSLPWSIPEDLKHFKSYTMGKVVVLGRKTYQSIGRQLPGRKFIVITTQHLDNVLCVDDINRALSVDYCYPEIVVAGGESIYRQTIDLANRLVITHIDSDFSADTYFPNIDLSVWKVQSSTDSYNDKYTYKFVEYVRL
jgi:dihydrofolate reductase